MPLSPIPQTPVPWSPAPLSSPLGQSPAHTRSPLISALSSARSISRNLFRSQPDGEIIGWLKHIADQQKKVLDRFDALISVLSGNPESASPLPEEPPATIQSLNPTPPSNPPSSPSVQPSPPQSGQDPREYDSTLLHLRSRSTSEKNFAVQLVRHFFTPQELDGRNVRGIGNKLPLDPDKIRKIKEIIFRFYPSSAAQQDFLWRECRKAIDSFLRNRKVTEARAT